MNAPDEYESGHLGDVSGATDAAMGWGEDTSRDFLELASTFVPRRSEQNATLCRLIPADPDETFAVVELAAGGGDLARVVLDAYPHCHYLALDGSDTMQERLRTVLAPYGERVEVRDFIIGAEEWRHALPQPLRCVLSSLCVHHLSGNDKRVLFADMAARLESDGALLIGDLVAPLTERARLLFAAQWETATREQSLDRDGTLGAYERFHEMRWNHYAETTEPDAMDMPSPLSEQLVWLREAGFAIADCFWMYAGHAIYGGYR